MIPGTAIPTVTSRIFGWAGLDVRQLVAFSMSHRCLRANYRDTPMRAANVKCPKPQPRWDVHLAEVKWRCWPILGVPVEEFHCRTKADLQEDSITLPFTPSSQ